MNEKRKKRFIYFSLFRMTASTVPTAHSLSKKKVLWTHSDWLGRRRKQYFTGKEHPAHTKKYS